MAQLVDSSVFIALERRGMRLSALAEAAADEPIAVNPHAKLRRLAAERGWQVEDWG